MLTKRVLFGATASLAVLGGVLFTLASRADLAPHPQGEVAVTGEVALTGQVTSEAEGSMEGVVVTAKREDRKSVV